MINLDLALLEVLVRLLELGYALRVPQVSLPAGVLVTKLKFILVHALLNCIVLL